MKKHHNHEPTKRKIQAIIKQNVTPARAGKYVWHKLFPRFQGENFYKNPIRQAPVVIAKRNPQLKITLLKLNKRIPINCNGILLLLFVVLGKMKNKAPHIPKSVRELHELLGLPKPKHPLISIYRYEKITQRDDKRLDFFCPQFYSIANPILHAGYLALILIHGRAPSKAVRCAKMFA